MTASAEADNVIERMSELWVIKLSHGLDMMDVRFMSDFFSSDSTMLAHMIVPFQRLSSYVSPPSIVGIGRIFPLI